jgi:hypothetical protein
VADGWCWFVLKEEYCWLVAGGWFVVREKYYWLVAGDWFVRREKYCWLVADKPSEHAASRILLYRTSSCATVVVRCTRTLIISLATRKSRRS